MPNYLYECEDCGVQFNAIEKRFTDVVVCTNCGGKANRLFTADGGSFRKGSGYWCDKKKGDK